tara:strand:+ start:195 stop:500 length:306 start_codon:yes stop_codon:yes gene_type:complete
MNKSRRWNGLCSLPIFMEARATVSVRASRILWIQLLSVPKPAYNRSRRRLLRLKRNITWRCRTDVRSRLIAMVSTTVVFVDTTRFKIILLVTVPEEAHLTA